MVEMRETAHILRHATRAQPGHPRRDRPRHVDLRRPLDRVGGRRAPARSRRARRRCSRPTTTSCAALAATARARAQRQRRGARVEGRGRVPAQAGRPAAPAAPSASRWRGWPGCPPPWSRAPARSCARSSRTRPGAGGRCRGPSRPAGRGDAPSSGCSPRRGRDRGPERALRGGGRLEAVDPDELSPRAAHDCSPSWQEVDARLAGAGA